MRINFILFIASSFEGRGHKNIQQVAPTLPYFLASFLSNQTNRSLFYDLPPHLKSVKKGSVWNLCYVKVFFSRGTLDSISSCM